jgi:membrane associated rhomboid family serine protease
LNRDVQYQFRLSITPTVKWLIIISCAIWFFGQIIAEHFLKVPISRYFALYPAKVILDFQIWQLGSYIFLHSLQVTHVVFNMITLWYFGSELENHWGKKFFLSYFLITGIGAAVIYCVGSFIYFMFNPQSSLMVVPVMGASGSVFGLLLAFGVIFGERIIHFLMVFPMKAKYFVLLIGAIEMASLLTADVNGGDVAYLAHLGGILSGFLTLQGWNWVKRWQWNYRAKKRKNLRLVVDNETKNNTNDPKYWN